MSVNKRILYQLVGKQMSPLLKGDLICYRCAVDVAELGTVVYDLEKNGGS